MDTEPARPRTRTPLRERVRRLIEQTTALNEAISAELETLEKQHPALVDDEEQDARFLSR